MLLEGRALDASPLEEALVALVRKSCLTPKRLEPADLRPVRELAGAGALEYAQVLGGFHFINRIADLLHVDSEALPYGLRRFEWMRSLSVRAAGWILGWMDLDNRPFEPGWEGAVERFAADCPAAGRAGLEERLRALEPRPQMIETLRLGREELAAISLGREAIAAIFRLVEEALPATEEEARGFHPRPSDPVEAFAFVGTRYAQRCTPEMIGRLRAAGFDDLGTLDLAIVVAEANAWARLRRLLDLDPGLLAAEAA